MPEPQAIFVLGGGSDREEFAAKLALQHPELEVWISTGSQPEKATKIFESAGVSPARLHLDYRAVDTVTNFTTMVGVFQQRGIEHVYLLTSDFHMRRAKAIAFFVFGSRGITLTSVETNCVLTQVLSSCQTESILRVLRDVLRSLFWLATRKTGASVGTKLQ